MMLRLASALLGFAAALARAEDAFRVTKPAAGDTYTISEEHFGRLSFDIEWTVPDAIADRPLMLTLSQGDSLDDMVGVEGIASDAENSGKFSWTTYLGDEALSGCNYTVYAKAWTDYAYSGYFTLLRRGDGGLNPEWTCPVDVGRLKPSNGSYTAPAVSTEDTSGGSGSGSDTSSGNANSGDGTTTSTSQGSSSGGGNGGGVSTTTLAVAVVVPIVVLLVVFAVLTVLGVRRGWFLRKQDRQLLAAQQQHHAPTPAASGFAGTPAGYADMQEREKGSGVQVGELHGNNMPHYSGGSAVHQLYGDESRR